MLDRALHYLDNPLTVSIYADHLCNITHRDRRNKVKCILRVLHVVNSYMALAVIVSG